ncbi:hypothetical protein FBZ89_10911 [Nitrospirillum amazonense]|uniref:Uncharacterized protein n=1 Tax=Nitrospirillum amazonense TaxID=28077 RepID=A0A560FAK2_9PROT|nr:hypothetical protein [Nitrospirillum amazonense]TWB18632.1 hypothetical protein FBZ89_10911 [Nitrospirillum amazonense]
MAEIDISIVVVAVSSFLFALGCGIFFHDNPVWKWIDIVYYSLSVFGVILLFVSEDLNRAMLRIQEKEREIERHWASAFPGAGTGVPAIPVLPASSPDHWRASYEALKAEQDLGELCRQAPSLDCAPHTSHASFIKRDFQQFDPGTMAVPADRARKEEDFCQRAYQLVDHLALNSGVGTDDYALVKQRLLAMERNEASALETAALAEAIGTSHDRILSAVPTEKYAAMEKLLGTEGEFAEELFTLLSFCATRPADAIAKQRHIDLLQSIQETRHQTPPEVQQAIREAEQMASASLPQRVSRFIRLNLWPFILTLALAGKFGKAVSGFGGLRRLRVAP